MKIASRLFIPLELLLAGTILSWGLSGWVGGGALFRDLSLDGRNLEWGLMLCGVGLAQIILGGMEWVIGRRWENERLMRCVYARCVLAFVATVVWLYMLFFISTAANREISFALWLQAPMGLLFSAWAFVGNYKVACVLDPEVPTVGLQKTIMMERSQLERARIG